MSGDSPNSHRNDIFDFKEGRSSPTPTSSKEVGVQSGSSAAGVVHASVLVEPTKEKEKEKEDKEKDEEKAEDRSSPTLNASHEDAPTSDEDKTLKVDEPFMGGGKDKKDDKKKLNGDADQLDGVWIPRDDKTKELEEGEDNCVVQCLYYSMQCCDCSIM